CIATSRVISASAVESRCRSPRKWRSYPPCFKYSARAAWGNEDVEMVVTNFKRSTSDLNRPGRTHPIRAPGARLLENDPQFRTSPDSSKNLRGEGVDVLES